MKPTIVDTIEYIKSAHAGQTTKGGEPYWTHPLMVMNLLPLDASVDELHAALLHDVIEDCGVTPTVLRKRGYSERTIWLVEKLSRPEGPDRPKYMDWIRSLAATKDIGLINIKLADNKHNSDPARIAALPEEERSIVKRYVRSMEILTEKLKEIEDESQGTN